MIGKRVCIPRSAFSLSRLTRIAQRYQTVRVKPRLCSDLTLSDVTGTGKIVTLANEEKEEASLTISMPATLLATDYSSWAPDGKLLAMAARQRSSVLGSSFRGVVNLVRISEGAPVSILVLSTHVYRYYAHIILIPWWVQTSLSKYSLT